MRQDYHGDNGVRQHFKSHRLGPSTALRQCCAAAVFADHSMYLSPPLLAGMSTVRQGVHLLVERQQVSLRISREDTPSLPPLSILPSPP